MSKEKNVQLAKKRFDNELHTKKYRSIHEDLNHLEMLINMCEIKKSYNILDLGTGNGYVAFEIAKRFPLANIVGLDIAENSISINNDIAVRNKLSNIKFITYDGINLPFERNAFDVVVSRYAFHHFPDPQEKVKQVRNILIAGGKFILSDPLTYKTDTIHFIDMYQNLKEDGHVHFFHLDEIKTLFKMSGFVINETKISKVSYPRSYNKNYEKLLKNTHKKIIEEYDIRITGKQIFATVSAYNIKAIKNYGT